MDDLKNDLIREALVNFACNLPVADSELSIPFPIKALLGGKSPVEFVMNALGNIPDEFIPYLVEVSKQVVEISEG